MRRVRLIHGFTLLEMLTALAIIALLIGLLIPAIGKIQTMAQTVKQKAQFHAIEVALEAFRSDVGDYPPSVWDRRTGAAFNTGYCGAQKLAEALVGMDGFGFHPKSQWYSDGLEGVDVNGDGTIDTYNPLYYGATGFDSLSDTDKANNLKLRKGPYLELEKANAVKLTSIYPAGSPLFNTLAGDTYILADMFALVKNKATGKRTGMPILYYRADTSKTKHDAADIANSIYNIGDNMNGFMVVNAPLDNPAPHPMATQNQIFYNRTANPNFTSPQRPYRNDSFILLSAGPDGLYGTPDDVYNFDESEK